MLIHDHIQPYMVIYGSYTVISNCLGQYGHITYDCMWLCMTIYGLHICSYMRPICGPIHDHIWTSFSRGASSPQRGSNKSNDFIQRQNKKQGRKEEDRWRWDVDTSARFRCAIDDSPHSDFNSNSQLRQHGYIYIGRRQEGLPAANGRQLVSVAGTGTLEEHVMADSTPR